MRVGIDLDNTVIDYDRGFCEAAIRRGWLPADAACGKRAVREQLLLAADGDRRYMQLQAELYGDVVAHARLYAGVHEFIRAAQRRGAALAIVSHKSRFAAAAPDGPDLHDAARAFLAAHAIDLPVYFEPTREAKCGRLGALGVTHAIDDLPEVFADASFPAGVRRWLFAPEGAPDAASADRCFRSWAELAAALADP